MLGLHDLGGGHNLMCFFSDIIVIIIAYCCNISLKNTQKMFASKNTVLHSETCSTYLDLF